jgi:hypothetical protein
LAHNLSWNPVPKPDGTHQDPDLTRTGINGAASNHIVCFITERCSYLVTNGYLKYYGPRAGKIFDLLGNTMTNPTPFSTKLTNAGTPWAQVVAATDLSTAYAAYANRGFRSMNILLRSEVPIRARLTDLQ